MTSTILVLGSVNTDFVVRGPRLPRPGETVLGGSFYSAPGGKGANQAVAAARAADKSVAFLAAVGDDDLGRAAVERFRGEGLVVDFIRIVLRQASGVALILVDEAGENLISVASGANMCLAPGDIEAVPPHVWSQARVLLASLESPLPAVVAALRRARRAGLTTILNPAPARAELADADWWPLVDIVTPNEHEAEVLTGIATRDEAGTLAAARRLQALGCRQAIITLGAAGSLVYDDEANWIPACSVTAADTTAAGDAFNGALAARLAEGASLVDAACWASRAAAISVTRPGAQPSLPWRREIEDFAQRDATR